MEGIVSGAYTYLGSRTLHEQGLLMAAAALGEIITKQVRAQVRASSASDLFCYLNEIFFVFEIFHKLLLIHLL